MKEESDRSERRDFQHEGSHLLGEMIHALQALEQVFSRESGTTVARFKILHEFFHSGMNGVGIIALAQRLNVTPALVTRQVQELERAGLVERRGDLKDNRRCIIQLTPEGKEELRRIHQQAHEIEEQLLQGFSPEDLSSSLKVLSGLNEKLNTWRKLGHLLVLLGLF